MAPAPNRTQIPLSRPRQVGDVCLGEKIRNEAVNPSRFGIVTVERLCSFTTADFAMACSS